MKVHRKHKICRYSTFLMNWFLSCNNYSAIANRKKTEEVLEKIQHHSLVSLQFLASLVLVWFLSFIFLSVNIVLHAKEDSFISWFYLKMWSITHIIMVWSIYFNQVRRNFTNPIQIKIYSINTFFLTKNGVQTYFFQPVVILNRQRQKFVNQRCED